MRQLTLREEKKEETREERIKKLKVGESLKEGNKEYYFYATNEIRCEKEKVKENQTKYKYYYKDGTLEIEAICKGDKIEGEMKKYYPNGNIAEIKPYKDGEVNGVWKFYWMTGKIQCEWEHIKGRAHGKRVFYHESGIKDTTYYVNGKEI